LHQIGAIFLYYGNEKTCFCLPKWTSCVTWAQLFLKKCTTKTTLALIFNEVKIVIQIHDFHLKLLREIEFTAQFCFECEAEALKSFYGGILSVYNNIAEVVSFM